MYNIIVYQSCNNNCIMCIHYELGEMTHTVFPRNLVAARFYFKALFGATTIQGRLDIESGVCRDRQTCGFDNQHCSPFVRLSMNNACVHTYIAVDPLPCGEISRVAFIGMICLKVR